MERAERFIQEIEEDLEEREEELGWEEGASDDVHGGQLPIELVRAGRREEVNFIEGRNQWELRSECIEVIGKPPIAMRWVDTDKGHMRGSYDVRRRM
eukprot:11102230-Karenia_brevis.AAC.1